jgi:hypothetical protein
MALGVAASALDLLAGVLTLVFTTGFSSSAFVAVIFYDSLPMLIAGVGIIAGLSLLRRRQGNQLGGAVIIIAGLVPIAVLYDVVRTIIVYGSEYIPFPLSLIYMLLIVLPMLMAVVCGIALAKTR